VEAALRERQSVREYSGDPVTLAELSQLLWAAQGVTHSRGRRTAPSAGALYPLELYVVAGRVDGLEKGLYRYRIGDHDLLEVSREDLQGELTAAALGQECIADAAAVIVVAGVVERSAVKYGERALRYVHMEVGAVAENIYLQATALGLGTVYVGAFRDAQVKRVLRMPEEDPFAILPVGRP
jgi:SagB-type dehydrogenase family enzyme